MASQSAKQIASELNSSDVKLGDIKQRGKEIKKDHDLALELWALGGLNPRLLATLIFDKSLIDQKLSEALAADMLEHDEEERNQLIDWLLANQLMKSKKTVDLLGSWQQHSSPLLRRLFWYHQARKRWTGQKQPSEETNDLLESIEQGILNEPPEVQWAMNFCAGWVGVYEPENRARCIKIGERTGLYKDEKVARNCTPSYLPEFIRIEAAKRE